MKWHQIGSSKLRLIFVSLCTWSVPEYIHHKVQNCIISDKHIFQHFKVKWKEQIQAPAQ